MAKSQEYIICQKISTPLEFPDEFFGIFSEFFRNFFEIFKPRTRSPGFRDLRDSFNVFISRSPGFRDFSLGIFSGFSNPSRISGFLVFFDLAQKFFIIKNPDPEFLGSEFGIPKNPIPKPTLSREALATV